MSDNIFERGFVSGAILWIVALVAGAVIGSAAADAHTSGVKVISDKPAYIRMAD